MGMCSNRCWRIVMKAAGIAKCCCDWTFSMVFDPKTRPQRDSRRLDRWGACHGLCLLCCKMCRHSLRLRLFTRCVDGHRQEAECLFGQPARERWRHQRLRLLV
jgi:hypothetical protein